MSVTRRSQLSYIELIVVMAAGKVVWSVYNLADPLVQRPLTSWPVMAVVALLGYMALRLSNQAGVPDLWSPDVSDFRRFTLPVLLGAGFGLLQIVLVMLQGIRVPMVAFPLSVPVYTTVGILSELVLHYIPLVGILFSISLIVGEGRSRRTAFWIVAVIISLWEPVLQLTMMMRMNILSSPAAGILPFLLVWVANLLPLYLLKRYGLLSAISWRLADYLVWHVLWGALAPVVYVSLGL